jgi:phosphoserine aminotransferase
MPKLFRMTKKGKLDEEIFQGSTINTPSMLCVEDALDALAWAEGVGGVKGLVARSEANLAAMSSWVAKSATIAFLAREAKNRSCTSICLKVIDPWFEALDADAKAAAIKKMVSILDKEGVAQDIAGYRDAPPGLRVWGGATVERSDIEALLPWLDWAYAEAKG